MSINSNEIILLLETMSRYNFMFDYVKINVKVKIIKVLIQAEASLTTLQLLLFILFQWL